MIENIKIILQQYFDGLIPADEAISKIAVEMSEIEESKC